MCQIQSAQREGVVLTWETAWEIHNSGFIVEHSGDGLIFEAIGQLAGSHSSREMRYYRFVHHLLSEGNQYYRLRQVDEDQNVTFSPIRVVRPVQSDDRASATVVEGRLDIQWTEEAPVDVHVYSLSGVMHYSKRGVRTRRHKVEMSAMPTGVYVVVIDSGEWMETLKFFKP